jgi:hypothetical protein
MSEYKRGWLFALVLYTLGLGSYFIANPDTFSSGEWVPAAFGFMVPALLFAYVLNAVIELWKGIATRRTKKQEGRWTVAARTRGCYCAVWDTEPGTYAKLGYEIGFCGTCERCGSPGHTRHYPGPVPYTGAWCDRCFRILAWSWPFRSWQGWGLILAVVALSAPFWRPIITAITGLLR